MTTTSTHEMASSPSSIPSPSSPSPAHGRSRDDISPIQLDSPTALTSDHVASGRRFVTLGLAFVVMLSTMFGAFAVASPSPASAWAWSSSVTLQGRAHCLVATDKVTKVEFWVRDNDDGQERYYRPGLSGTYSKAFSQRLSVPGAGVNVWARVTCRIGGSYWTNFGVKRPTTGTTATRNLCATRFCF